MSNVYIYKFEAQGEYALSIEQVSLSVENTELGVHESDHVEFGWLSHSSVLLIFVGLAWVTL